MGWNIARVQSYIVRGSFYAALPCRSKVRFAPFFLQEKHPPASLHFLFHKKLRSARLFGCKRPYDGSLSLPAFACYEGLTPTAEMPKKIFSCDSHKNPRTSVPGFFSIPVCSVFFHKYSDFRKGISSPVFRSCFFTEAKSVWSIVPEDMRLLACEAAAFTGRRCTRARDDIALKTCDKGGILKANGKQYKTVILYTGGRKNSGIADGI